MSAFLAPLKCSTTAIGTCSGAKEGTSFEIEIRDKRVPTRVVKPHYYMRVSHL